MHRILFIGVGSIGERHLRCFLLSGRVKAFVCEPNATLRALVCEKHSVEKSFSDLEHALAGETYDAAIVATPAPSHISIARRFVEAGVHVLIEKPLSTSLDGVNELQRSVKEKQVVSAVAYVLREYPALVAMREALLQGRFGAPVQLVAMSGQNFPTYRPAYRDIYYARRESGGGAIPEDSLTHLLNAGEWLVGPIERVQVDASHQLLDGVSVEDTVHVITRQGRVMGSYSLNQYQAPNEMTITVVCERGTARFESHESRWRWMEKPDSPWQVQTFEPIGRDGPFIRQAGRFLDAIEHRSPPACSLEEGIQTLRVNLALLAAMDAPSWRMIRPEAVKE